MVESALFSVSLRMTVSLRGVQAKAKIGYVLNRCKAEYPTCLELRQNISVREHGDI